MPFSTNRSVSISGSVSNGVVNTGDGTNISVGHNAVNLDPEKEQLRQDLKQMQASLKQLQSNNPNAGQAEANAVLTAMTPKPVQQRLVAAIASGGKAVISEFLDNAYAKVVVAAIEGWRS